jgi:hypothetical protein
VPETDSCRDDRGAGSEDDHAIDTWHDRGAVSGSVDWTASDGGALGRASESSWGKWNVNASVGCMRQKLVTLTAVAGDGSGDSITLEIKLACGSCTHPVFLESRSPRCGGGDLPSIPGAPGPAGPGE